MEQDDLEILDLLDIEPITELNFKEIVYILKKKLF